MFCCCAAGTISEMAIRTCEKARNGRVVRSSVRLPIISMSRNAGRAKIRLPIPKPIVWSKAVWL